MVLIEEEGRGMRQGEGVWWFAVEGTEICCGD